MLEGFHLIRLCAIALIILTSIVLGHHIVTYTPKINSAQVGSSVTLADANTSCLNTDLFVARESQVIRA